MEAKRFNDFVGVAARKMKRMKKKRFLRTRQSFDILMIIKTFLTQLYAEHNLFSIH